jgi:3-mercaptopyruvate sulfurtransferase SseA
MKKVNLFWCGVLLAGSLGFSLACNQSNAAPGQATALASPAAATPAPPATQSAEDKMPRIRVEEAKALAAKGEAVIIDVRGPEAYKTSHIKGALDHALSRLETKDFKDLPKDKKIIAYCT